MKAYWKSWKCCPWQQKVCLCLKMTPGFCQCVWNDPLVVFGNDPRLPGARNAVPGSQNGVYSGLCLKMTLEVCLKMTPLPVSMETLHQNEIVEVALVLFWSFFERFLLLLRFFLFLSARPRGSCRGPAIYLGDLTCEATRHLSVKQNFLSDDLGSHDLWDIFQE